MTGRTSRVYPFAAARRKVKPVPVSARVSACSAVKVPATPDDVSPCMVVWAGAATVKPVSVWKAARTSASAPAGISNRNVVCRTAASSRTAASAAPVRTLTRAQAATIPVVTFSSILRVTNRPSSLDLKLRLSLTVSQSLYTTELVGQVVFRRTGQDRIRNSGQRHAPLHQAHAL